MIRFFAAHPTAANLLMLLLLVLGVLSLSNLRRETFPDFSAGLVQVQIAYPGATAAEVEDAICRRVEDAIEGVTNLKEVRAQARENIAIITAEKKDTGDIQTFLNDIKAEVEGIDDFPSTTEKPIIKEAGAITQVISVAVAGDMSPSHLKAYAEQLKSKLLANEQVSLIDIEGFSDHQIRIELNSLGLLRHNLSVAQVSQIVKQQSLDLPVGSLETQNNSIMVKVAEQGRKPIDFEDVVVMARPDGAEVKLGDIAKISDAFELDEAKVMFNGRRAAILRVSKTKTDDILTVYDAVAKFVADERQVAPKGVTLELTQDLASITRDRLQMLLKNGGQGLLLVFFTLWLFFNARLSFWVTMGLPVSFLGAFYFLPLAGMTINMITMVGLLLALGLLMDDAIVLAENIATHLSKNQSTLKAVINGVSEVKVGVISSFLTTLAVFGPIIFMEGNIGKVLKVMPVILIIVLSVSLIEAFFILPNHLAHSLDGQNGDSSFRKKFDAKIDFLRESVLGKIVDVAQEYRYLTVGLTIFVFFISVALLAGGALKFRAFPDLDGDVISARLLLPQGTPLEKTEEVTKKLTEALARVNEELKPKQPDQQDVVRNLSIQYNVNADAYENGAHVATINVDLLKAEERNARIDHIFERWREEIGPLTDVISLKLTEPTLGPAGRPIDIRLSGEDLDQLKAASLYMMSFLNKLEGILDLSDDLRPGKPEVRLALREGTTGLGLTTQDIAGQLRAAFHGSNAGNVQVGTESYEIDVRLAPKDRDSLADLDNFRITTSDGNQIPLGALAHLTSERGYARIARVDGRRTVSIQGDLDSNVANTAEVINLMTKTFLPEFQEKYPAVSVSIEGEIKEGKITGASLKRGFLMGLIGIFIILSFQFRSYIEPAMVMFAIPMSFVGVVWGHYLMGHDLSMPSMIGFVSLAGVVVNDSILLVEFIKSARSRGMSIAAAAVQASRERFRAVLLTSLTTIAGLLPLLAERSMQAQILIPLAISLVFGLMASTIMVLIVIPCIYSIFGEIGLAVHIDEEPQHH